MRQLDIALCLHLLIPNAQYGGSLTVNTEASYEALRWEDNRPKPTWQEAQNYWIENQEAFNEFYTN
jgi:hypothetical protein